MERDRGLARRRTRRKKLKKLRARFHAAKDSTEQRMIQEKAHKVSPFINCRG